MAVLRAPAQVLPALQEAARLRDWLHGALRDIRHHSAVAHQERRRRRADSEKALHAQHPLRRRRRALYTQGGIRLRESLPHDVGRAEGRHRHKARALRPHAAALAAHALQEALGRVPLAHHERRRDAPEYSGERHSRPRRAGRHLLRNNRAAALPQLEADARDLHYNPRRRPRHRQGGLEAAARRLRDTGAARDGRGDRAGGSLIHQDSALLRY